MKWRIHHYSTFYKKVQKQKEKHYQPNVQSLREKGNIKIKKTKQLLVIFLK